MILTAPSRSYGAAPHASNTEFTQMLLTFLILAAIAGGIGLACVAGALSAADYGEKTHITTDRRWKP